MEERRLQQVAPFGPEPAGGAGGGGGTGTQQRKPKVAKGNPGGSSEDRGRLAAIPFREPQTLSEKCLRPSLKVETTETHGGVGGRTGPSEDFLGMNYVAADLAATGKLLSDILQ